MLKDLVLKNRSYRRFYQDERISEDTLRELADLARMAASSANCQALKYYLAVDEETCAKIYPSLAWAGALPDWDGPEEGERPSAYIVIVCQALKYYLAVDEETCAKIYPSLAWAGALPDWDGPEEGERPSAYIVIVCDGSIAKNKMWDEGIAAQTIMLAWAGALPDWDGPEEGERPSAYIVIVCDGSIAKNKMWDEGIAAQTIMLGAAEKGLGGCMIGSINRSQLAETLGLDSERYHISLVLALGKPKETVVTVPVGEDGSTTYYRDENQVHYVPKRSLEEIIL